MDQTFEVGELGVTYTPLFRLATPRYWVSWFQSASLRTGLGWYPFGTDSGKFKTDNGF